MSAVRPATSRLRRARAPVSCAKGPSVRLGFALSVGLALAGAASAQSETAPTQQPVAPLAEPGTPPTAGQPTPSGQGAPPAFAPGLVDKLGDLIKGSVDGIKGSVDSLSSTMKGTRQTIQDINQGTVDTLSKLPVAGFASVHYRLPAEGRMVKPALGV